MKKRTTVIALLLALTMLFSCLLAGCGNKNDSTPGTTKADTVTKADDGNSGSDDNSGNNDTGSKPGKVGNDYNLKKVDTINTKDLNVSGFITICENGFYYRDNGKYGIISLDGKKDTGMIFSSVTTRGNYFLAAGDTEGKDALAAVNNATLIDSDCNTVIPMEYAVIKVKENRFAQAYKAIAETDNEDDALIFSSDRLLALDAQDGDKLYTGEWVVYDLQTKQLVPGITGTKPKEISAYGNIIGYTDDNGDYVYADANGNKLPSEGRYFYTGRYVLFGDTEYTVYDTDGKKLFSFTNDEYNYISDYGTYFEAQETDSDNRYVLDSSGKKVGGPFEKGIDIVGNLVFTEDKVYNFNGDQLIEGSFAYLYTDKVFGTYYMATNSSSSTDNKGRVLFTEDGTVLFSDPDMDESITFDTSDFTVCKKIDGKNYYLSIPDGDFTIKGSSLVWGTGLVEVDNDDNTSSLVSTFSGKTLLDHCIDFDVTVRDGYDTFKLLVEKDDNTYDIYMNK